MPNPIAQVEPEFTDIGSAKTFVCAELVGETAPLRMHVQTVQRNVFSFEE
jgi:hypothetical protein